MAKHKVLKDRERIMAFALLQGMAKDGKIPHGGLTRVAKVFGVTRVTISSLWKRGTQASTGSLIKSPDILNRMSRRGRPPKYDMSEVRAHVKSVPLRQRKAIRDLSEQLKSPRRQWQG